MDRLAKKISFQKGHSYVRWPGRNFSGTNHKSCGTQNDSLKYFKIKILIHPVITSKHRLEFYGYGKILDISDDWILFAALGPIIQTPVSANLRLNCNPGFFIFLSKALSRIIFSILFRASNHQIVGKEN